MDTQIEISGEQTDLEKSMGYQYKMVFDARRIEEVKKGEKGRRKVKKRFKLKDLGLFHCLEKEKGRSIKTKQNKACKETAGKVGENPSKCGTTKPEEESASS